MSKKVTIFAPNDYLITCSLDFFFPPAALDQNKPETHFCVTYTKTTFYFYLFIYFGPKMLCNKLQ